MDARRRLAPAIQAPAGLPVSWEAAGPPTGQGPQRQQGGGKMPGALRNVLLGKYFWKSSVESQTFLARKEGLCSCREASKASRGPPAQALLSGAGGAGWGGVEGLLCQRGGRPRPAPRPRPWRARGEVVCVAAPGVPNPLQGEETVPWALGPRAPCAQCLAGRLPARRETPAAGRGPPAWRQSASSAARPRPSGPHWKSTGCDCVGLFLDSQFYSLDSCVTSRARATVPMILAR